MSKSECNIPKTSIQMIAQRAIEKFDNDPPNPVTGLPTYEYGCGDHGALDADNDGRLEIDCSHLVP